MHDYHNMIMKIKLGLKKKLWTTTASKEINSCGALMFEKLCKGRAHCFTFVVTKGDIQRQAENQGQLQAEDMGQKSNHDEIELLPKEIRSVLMAHTSVLDVPTILPTLREFDHKIRLVNKTKPINVPPFRYAHFQKGRLKDK